MLIEKINRLKLNLPSSVLYIAVTPRRASPSCHREGLEHKAKAVYFFRVRDSHIRIMEVTHSLNHQKKQKEATHRSLV